MRKPSFNKKGQGISINVLVILALAVFSVFLVIGFITGGFSFFAGAFGEVTKATSGDESARLNCEQSCTSYLTSGSPSPVSDFWKEKLCEDRFEIDLNGDGLRGRTLPDGSPNDADAYKCSRYLTLGKCGMSCPNGIFNN